MKNHNWQKRIKFMQVFIKTGLIFTKALLSIVRAMSVLMKLIAKMKIQSFIRKFGTIIALTSLVQAAQFHLPNRTPGLQAGLVRQNVNGNPVNCEHVIIPNTNCHLYFPTDMVLSQPQLKQGNIPEQDLLANLMMT